MKKSKGMGMFVKIFILSILCMIIPLAVTTVVVTDTAAKGMQDTASKTLRSIAEKETVAMEDFISAQKTLTSSVAANTSVIQALMAVQEGKGVDETTRGYTALYLGSIQKTSEEIYENFFITTFDEGYADCLDNKTLHNVGEEKFYKECKEKGYYFGNNISPVTGNPVYVIAYAINNPATGEFMGTVNNSIDVAKMSERMLKDDTYTIALIDLDGNIIAHKDTTQILSFNIKENDTTAWDNYLKAGAGAFTYTDPFTQKFTYTGFAVVADEIRQLAESSKGTANNIQEISDGVVSAVNELVEASNSMMIVVTEVINRDYQGFEQAADTYYDDAEKMNAIIGKYNESMQELKQTVSAVAEAIKTVSKTMGECTTGVGDATDNVNRLVDSMSQIKHGADEDLEGITVLQNEISKFV